MWRTPEFEEFIAPARALPAFWRIAAALVTGFLFQIFAAVFVIGIIGVLVEGGSTAGAEPNGISDYFDMMSRGDTPFAVALVLGSFFASIGAVVIMAAWHNRRVETLFGPRRNFGLYFAKGALVVVGLYAIFALCGLISNAPPYVPNLPFATWLPHMLWALPLLMVQVGSEELMFRGYLQQQLAVRFSHPFVWMVLPSVLFGLLHYDATYASPAVTWGYVFWAGVFGLLAADLTRVTGNLGAAIGFHFANNFFAIMVYGVPDDLGGVALYHYPFGKADIGFSLVWTLRDMLYLFVSWAALRLWLRPS